MSDTSGTEIDGDLGDFKKFLDLEFQIGDTHFKIIKLYAMASYKLFEKIRVAASEKLAGIDFSGGFGQQQAMTALMSLPPQFVEDLRVELFASILFRNRNDAKTFQKLGGAEDMAFQGLEPVAVYEVLLRSLAVNFSPSFLKLARELDFLNQTTRL